MNNLLQGIVLIIGALSFWCFFVLNAPDWMMVALGMASLFFYFGIPALAALASVSDFNEFLNHLEYEA